MIRKLLMTRPIRKSLLCLALLSGLVLMSCSTKCCKSEDKMKYDGNFKARLEGVTVQNLNGEEVNLESLWADRRIVLTFFRHYG